MTMKMTNQVYGIYAQIRSTSSWLFNNGRYTYKEPFMKLGICAAFGPLISRAWRAQKRSFPLNYLRSDISSWPPFYMFLWKESKVHNLLYVLNVVLSPICAPFQLQCLISPSKHTSSLHFIIGDSFRKSNLMGWKINIFRDNKYENVSHNFKSKYTKKA